MKTSNEADKPSYEILKHEIEETYGKRINSARDCILLSEEIYTKISFTVNSNTLRRFFGLIRSDFRPSSTTLDIVSKYCGFSSFDEFKKLKINFHKRGNEDYYSESILNFLVSLFKDTPVKSHNDKAFCSVVENTIQFLRRHIELVDKFQRAVSKTKNGRDFYFEQFVNIDALNSYYGNGLLYYLSENTTPEAQIFGHSLLCLKSWFIENSEGVKRHYDEVMNNQVSKHFHPSLCARYHATRLLYTDIASLPIDHILMEMQQAHAAVRHQADDLKPFPYFEYMVAPVLLMTGHVDEALYYVNYSLNNYPQKHIGITQSIHQTMNLTKALTLAIAGRKQEAENLYRHVYPSRFTFLLKKTNTIQYLLLGQYLGKSNAKSDQQLKKLIQETGFTRLNKILATQQNAATAFSLNKA